MGKIANVDLPKYYNIADIFCIPSQYEEGYGRVVIEAVACGVPVIGSNKGGIPEALNETVSILVEPTKDNLKSAISGLYFDEHKYQMCRGQNMLLAKTIETTGFVNHQHQLSLDESLPIAETSRVRVIVIVTEEAQITKSKAILKQNSRMVETFGSTNNYEVDFIEELTNNPKHIPAEVSFFSRAEANER